MEQRQYRPSQAAQLLGVNTWTMRRWIREGRVPARRSETGRLYINNAEALVVDDSIAAPQDLVGKTIAVPFGSTTHKNLRGTVDFSRQGDRSGPERLHALKGPASC